MALGKEQEHDAPMHLRAKLESALITATNLALCETDPRDHIRQNCIVFVLNYTFEVLADHQRAQLEYDLLLPILVDAAFLSPEGLEHGYWLGLVDSDVVQSSSKHFRWSSKSKTFAFVKQVQSRPMVSSLGPMARLIAHSIEFVQDPALISATVDRLSDFARTLAISWRQNKLSEIDVLEETERLDAETFKTTLPVLWQILRMSLFATIIVLRAALGRVLGDASLSANTSAPFIAIQCLHTLRNLYFISARLGQTASSQYTFVNYTAIDILSQYPEHSESLLKSIRPAEFGRIPHHALDRCHDLFFLNTAEHFTLALSPRSNDELLVAAAVPYLATGGSNHLLEIFEAGHSMTLAVLAAPHNTDLAIKHLPYYVEALLKAFPANLSSRQFRIAFKTVIRITAPPSRISETQPMLQSILLEILHGRALGASPVLLPKGRGDVEEAPLSEHAVLIMTIIDSLCYLPVPVLQEWLPLTAELLARIDDSSLRQRCQERFWEALSSGEMDVERAAIAVAWWTTRGGREMVLFGDEPPEEDLTLMSGALQHESKL